MPRFRTILALALCLLTAAVTDLRAQSGAGFPMGVHGPDRPRVDDTIVADPGGGYRGLTGRPRVRVRRTDTPPVIDGRLDDEVWRTAAMLSEFVQQAPLDGAPATEETEIYISYDSDHIYFAFYLHYSDPGIMRANRVDRDTAWQDDLMTVYLDTFMDQQVCYDFDLNGYNVQGDGIINASQTRGGPISHRRSVLGGSVLQRHADRRGRLHGRDGDPVQELPVPGAAARRGAPLGLPVRARDQGQEPGERGLGADVARRSELHGADGRPRGDDRPVHQPQPGDPAVVHRHPVQLARPGDGRLRQPGHRPGRGRERQVRNHVEPDRRLHRQPRLLADRVGSAADRGQSALPPVLSRAAALLPGGSGDLRVRLAGRPGAHADAGGPERRSEADRQGGQHDARRDGDRRRGAGEARRSERPRLRQERAGGDRPGALRPLLGVAHRGAGDGSRVPRRAQPRGGDRRPVPVGSGHPLQLRRLPVAGPGRAGRPAGGADARRHGRARGTPPAGQDVRSAHRSRLPHRRRLSPTRGPAARGRQRGGTAGGRRAG